MRWIFILAAVLLSVNTLYASESSRISFEAIVPEEFDAIQQHVIHFYSEELLHAGLFADLNQAIDAAMIECNRDPIDHPNKYYCHLISNESSTRCGYLIYAINDREAYLDAIHLTEAYRGQGLGKQVLQELESDLKMRGVEVIRLYVFDHNVVACALYDKMGYAIETTYSHDDKLIGYHMKKDI